MIYSSWIWLVLSAFLSLITPSVLLYRHCPLLSKKYWFIFILPKCVDGLRAEPAFHSTYKHRSKLLCTNSRSTYLGCIMPYLGFPDLSCLQDWSLPVFRIFICLEVDNDFVHWLSMFRLASGCPLLETWCFAYPNISAFPPSQKHTHVIIIMRESFGWNGLAGAHRVDRLAAVMSRCNWGMAGRSPSCLHLSKVNFKHWVSTSRLQCCGEQPYSLTAQAQISTGFLLFHP